MLQVNIFKIFPRVACRRRNWELLLCFLIKGITGDVCLRYFAITKKCLKLSVWDFPSKEDIQTIQSKFIFMGHCKPNEVTKRGKKAEVESEVEKTARIYKYIK